MPDVRTAGRVFAGAGSAEELLEREVDFGTNELFVGLETVVAHVLERTAAAHVATEYRFGDRGAYGTVTFVDLPGGDRQVVDEHYRLDAQEHRGAWFLPEDATLLVGLPSTPWFAARTTRFFWNAVRDTSVKLDLRRSGDAFLLWVLVPLLEQMYRPFSLLADTGKLKDLETQRSAWAEAEVDYKALGLSVDGAFATMRIGGRWAELPLDAQLECRGQLLKELASRPAADISRHWRANSTRRLITAFYRKAKTGTPLAAKVLTRPLQRDFAAAFAGDWLAFLRYLGEPPNTSEEITTALPETRLYVPDKGQTETVAAASGVPADEVERIIASYLGQDAVVSPVRERVAILERWWPLFDEIHARQTPGMENLWGLVDDGIVDPVSGAVNEVRAKAGQFRRLLPADLAADIERLWDGITLAKYPDRIVSEFHPYQQMADTLGPAVELWHGIALTCWFVCEGPTSRTDLLGMEHYYRRPLTALDDAGFPIDRAMFAELIAAESKLGTPETVGGYATHLSGPNGISVTATFGTYQRRNGFELLRDVVTRHRRSWAQKLDEYLQQRWEHELREAGREFNRHVAARGKAPTLKQFASYATTTANHWFGGDLRALYAALGEPAPGTPERFDLLAGDPLEFVEALYIRLGGQHLEPGRMMEDVEARTREWNLSRLARESLRYLQIFEATGAPPSFDDFTRPTIDWNVIGGEEEGWARYQATIDELRVMRTASKTHEPTAVDPPKDVDATPLPEAQWAKDPTGRNEYRYWNGSAWTEHVATGGRQSKDPLP